MPQLQTAIVGHNNTQAQVTGQEELLVKVNSLAPTTGVARTPNMIRPTDAGDINLIEPVFYSVSVANVGTADGTIFGGEIIKPGEVLNFSADALNNYFTRFDYDATGTEFIIIFIS